LKTAIIQGILLVFRVTYIEVFRSIRFTLVDRWGALAISTHLRLSSDRALE